MRKVLVLTVLLSLCLVSFAQQLHHYTIDKSGKQSEENKEMLVNTEGDLKQFVSHDQKFSVNDLKYQMLQKDQQNYDPGSGPEGDYMQAVKFSTDGTKFFVVNRHTYNVTVFDRTTMDTLANIPVGNGAVNIDLTDTKAVITCMFDNYVTIVDLSDYSTVNLPTSHEQPINVKIHPNGNLAYVSCEIDDVCDVIDLTSNTVVSTITNFPAFTESLSWSSGNGRNFVKVNEFFFTQGGDYLVVATPSPENLIKFFNTTTNTLEGSVTVNSCRNLGISPDSSIVFTTSFDNDLAYRIDVATRTIIGNPVAIPDGPSGSPGIVSNPDGTKIYFGTNGNHGTLIDFIDEEAVTFSQTYSAFWCRPSYDNLYAVHGNYNFSIVNFDTETVEDVYPGYSQSFGAASPTDYYAVAFDPLRMEGVHLYDISTPSDIIFDGTVLPADEYEGDAPWRVQVTPDGTKAVMANHLSQSVSVFNISNNSIDTIFHFPANGDLKNIAVTHNSDYAIACFDDLNQSKIIDLNTLEIAASINGGGHTIRITPDDAFAYVSNIAGSDRINVIELDGASSSNIANIITGQMGATYAHYGIFSDIRIDPSGNYCVAAVSFDDQVKIIDIATNTIVQTLSGFDFPLQLSFNEIGDKLAVSNYYGNTVSIINFDGASSSVQGTYPTGAYPTRINYNFFDNRFYICNNNDNNVMKMDPSDGSVTETINLNGSPVKVDFDVDGNSMILYSGDPNRIVNSSGESYDIPYTPAHFCNNQNDISAVISPGLDNLSIIQWGSSEGPHPISFTPANGENNAAIDVQISANFDVSLTEVDFSGITITPDPGNIMCGISDQTLNIAHDDLDYNTEYSVFIPAGSISDGINPLENDIEWTFTTTGELTYDVTFYVHDQFDTPLEGAIVDIDGNVETTDINGEAVFYLPEGEISYTVTLDSYVETGDYTVTNETGQTVDIMILIGNINSLNDQFKIFPNPSEGVFNIQINKGSLKNGITVIYDLSGKEIFKGLLTQSMNQIDISDKEAGIYTLCIKNNKKSYYFKVILK